MIHFVKYPLLRGMELERNNKTGEITFKIHHWWDITHYYVMARYQLLAKNALGKFRRLYIPISHPEKDGVDYWIAPFAPFVMLRWTIYRLTKKILS